MADEKLKVDIIIDDKQGAVSYLKEFKAEVVGASNVLKGFRTAQAKGLDIDTKELKEAVSLYSDLAKIQKTVKQGIKFEGANEFEKLNLQL